jgi:hypothetical protein
MRLATPLVVALVFVTWGICCQSHEGSPFLSLLAIPWYIVLLSASMWAVWNVGIPVARPLLRFYARFGAAVALSTTCLMLCVFMGPILYELLSPRYVVLGREITPNSDLVVVAEPAPGLCHFIRLLPCP